ncbi:MAG: class II glutamine amidotransferase [Candidatus Eisenbacteria bacterium]
MYGFLASQPTRVECAAIRSQEALARQRYRHSRNLPRAVGWGAAVFQEGEPAIQRRVISNHEEFRFDPKVAAAHTHAAITHVRTSTAGKPERKNTHPFFFLNWAFAHVGTVENFNTLRRELMGELNPEYRRAIGGATDSEHAFFLFLSYLKRSAGSVGGETPIHRVRDSFMKALSMLNEMTGRSGSLIRSHLTFFATNQQVFLASRQGGPLYWLERDRPAVCKVCGESHGVVASGESYHAIVLATEPLSGEEWREVPEDHYLFVDPDLAVDVLPIE